MVLKELNIASDTMKHIKGDIADCEKELGDEAESIIISERYAYIAKVMKECLQRSKKAAMSTSDKIDRIVTNRFNSVTVLSTLLISTSTAVSAES